MYKEKLKKYLEDKFQPLRFEDHTHTYTVGKDILIPTSNKIKNFYPEFPTFEASYTYAENRGLNQDDVIREWEEKAKMRAAIGTDVHDFAEKYVLSDKKYKLKKSDPNYELKSQVIKFWKEIPDYYTCFAVEQRMYSPIHRYAGTTDFLLLDHRYNSVVVGDYKTNANIYKGYGDYMYEPFQHLLNNPYNHYQLQLSYYQILLEDVGTEVTNRVVVWLKPNAYELLHPEDFTQKLRKRLNHDNR